jgi:formylglycine-generating enzyme required for sulfatase activity
MEKVDFILICVIMAGLVLILPVRANNIVVSTPTITGVNTTDDYAFVQFDLSWNNSWRDDVNWDAAWVFVKYKVTGGDWNQAYLNTTEGNHSIPSGYECSVGLTGSYGIGVFVYRNSNGSGNTIMSNVQLRWEYAANGLADGTTVTVKVFGIEMVYVPQGSFFLGDGSTSDITGQFEEGTGGTPFSVTSENSLTLGGGGAGSLGNNNASGMDIADDYNDESSKILPAEYPKGFNDFFIMKYEISQEQYAEFLNSLTTTQANTRNITGIGNHYTESKGTISGTHPNFYATAADRACNFIGWGDGCAYADWAGLRPMTELEYEKACRGNQAVVAGEYAWGNTNLFSGEYTISNEGQPDESISNQGTNTGNAWISGLRPGSYAGPVRVGIFANSTTSRQAAGSSYYGVMNMSDNLAEEIVAVGSSSGRNFTGNHGNGTLSTNGNANETTWPGLYIGEVRVEDGSGNRWGNWNSNPPSSRVSDRWVANGAAANGRNSTNGFRCIRTAP